MEIYKHKVQYYETDKMGITHHFNYIKWMEEARVDWLEKIGWGFDKLEALGMVSPVVDIHCKYINSTDFNDIVEIKVWLKEYKGVKLIVSYKMINAKTGEIVADAESKHCFTTKEGRPIIIKKQYPEFDKVLRKILGEKN